MNLQFSTACYLDKLCLSSLLSAKNTKQQKPLNVSNPGCMSTKVRVKHPTFLFLPAAPIQYTTSGNYIFCLIGVDLKLFSNKLDIYKAIHVFLYPGFRQIIGGLY